MLFIEPLLIMKPIPLIKDIDILFSRTTERNETPNKGGEYKNFNDLFKYGLVSENLRERF